MRETERGEGREKQEQKKTGGKKETGGDGSKPAKVEQR